MLSERKTEKLSLLGEWSVKDVTPNSVTLDRCDYYFDGELIAKDGYVLDILPRLNERRRATELKQVYRFKSEIVPEKIFLTTETPEIFDIRCNGKAISNVPVGDFVDKSFKLLDISGAVTEGENEIVLTSTVVQLDKTYEHLSKSWAFESMKNSLSYDMEIEPIYIVGDFGVKMVGEVDAFEAASYRVDGYPVITEAPKTVIAEALDESGYPEFAGDITLVRDVDITDTAKHVRLLGAGINSVHIRVNGIEAGVKLYAPYEVDISDYLKVGKNTIELKIINNLRNMQGPHHLKGGDDSAISPRSFYRESNVFNHNDGANESCHDLLDQFDERICLVRFGLRD